MNIPLPFHYASIHGRSFELDAPACTATRDPEGAHRDAGKDAGGDIRVCFCPGLRRSQRIEFGDDQAAGKTRGPGVGAVYRRKRAAQRHAPGSVQFEQARKVGGTGSQALFEAVRHIFADDGIEHD